MGATPQRRMYAQGRLSRLRRATNGPARSSFRRVPIELKLSSRSVSDWRPVGPELARKRKGSGLVGVPRPASGIARISSRGWRQGAQVESEFGPAFGSLAVEAKVKQTLSLQADAD